MISNNHRTDFIKTLKDYLDSKEFSIILESTLPAARQITTGLVIEYAILHKDLFEINKYCSFLNSLFNANPPSPDNNYYHIEQKQKVLRDSVDRKISRHQLNESVESYIKREFYDRGYLYHSTNASVTELINQNGIDPKNRVWQHKDLKTIQQIFAKTGIYHIFGLIDINSQNNVFISDNFQSLYKYASTSPEWFNLFAAGLYVPKKLGYDVDAYKRSDYVAAKNNINLFIQSVVDGTYQDNIEQTLNLLVTKGVDLKGIVAEIDGEYDKRPNDEKADIFRDVMYSPHSQFSKVEHQKFTSYERGILFMSVYDIFMRGDSRTSAIADADIDAIKDFFEKYWNILGSDKRITYLINRGPLGLGDGEPLVAMYSDLSWQQPIPTKFLNYIELPYI